MKKTIYIGIAFLLGLGFTSCEDFLQRDPLDFGNDQAYFKTVNDLAIYNNTFYKILPKMETNWGGVYAIDNNSDNQTSKDANMLFYPGDKQTPLRTDAACQWKFEQIRDLNYFIKTIKDKIAANSIVGSQDLIEHYLGEAYFFRAYDYFRILTNYGDAPLLEEVLGEEFDELAKKSKRAPRNEVARFIIKDLDTAIEKLLDNAPQVGRITKDAAILMKARVALYEATWLKYHQGTAFTPGNNKWPGSTTYPNFQFEGGSIESEYNYFFDLAIESSDKIASKRVLTPDYQGMFNSLGELTNVPEVILARYYAISKISHSATHFLRRTGGGTGYTKAFVETFLMQNGLPIYASNSTYYGDKQILDVKKDRDFRLQSSLKDGGLVIVDKIVDGITVPDTLVNYKPQIHVVGNQGTATGYEVAKWVSDVPGQDESAKGTTATPIFRAAEAYLIYLEAYYERNGTLGGNCDNYWRALRARAKVDVDYQKTITATDLTKENDLAVYSRGNLIDKTLYNIRRERRCEFIAEGMRLNDLKRWRALDTMKSYQMEGMNLWDQLYTIYEGKDIAEGVVSQRGLGVYIRPFQSSSNSVVYDGYNFPKAHYLEAVPVSEILMTGGVKSPIYQNPGWPTKSEGTADYTADFD